jgi:hypothetical protein
MDAGTEPVTLVLIIIFFYLYFLFGLEVARLVDPARDFGEGWHGTAWHGNVGRTYFYDHDGLCSILRFFIHISIFITRDRDQSYPFLVICYPRGRRTGVSFL